MTARQTPGKWRMGDVTNGRRRVFRADCQPGESAICSLDMEGRVASEVDANARLIAAAPDLLAALEAILAQIDPKNTPVGLGNILNAHAAIARAKGAV